MVNELSTKTRLVLRNICTAAGTPEGALYIKITCIPTRNRWRMITYVYIPFLLLWLGEYRTLMHEFSGKSHDKSKQVRITKYSYQTPSETTFVDLAFGAETILTSSSLFNLFMWFSVYLSYWRHRYQHPLNSLYVHVSELVQNVFYSMSHPHHHQSSSCSSCLAPSQLVTSRLWSWGDID